MIKVLVADDSETVQLMLRRRLEDAGYEVATAADGKATLEALGVERPDVILLDAMMPGMSGIDALRELRASGDSTPVLLISAYRYGEEPEEAMKLGADDCVGKPFDWDGLIAKIEELT